MKMNGYAIVEGILRESDDEDYKPSMLRGMAAGALTGAGVGMAANRLAGTMQAGGRGLETSANQARLNQIMAHDKALKAHAAQEVERQAAHAASKVAEPYVAAAKPEMGKAAGELRGSIGRGLQAAGQAAEKGGFWKTGAKAAGLGLAAGATLAGINRFRRMARARKARGED